MNEISGETEELSLPCNEEDPAFLAIFFCDKVEIVDSITTLICRETSSKVFITLAWPTKFLHNYLLQLLLNLKDNETMSSFRLELQNFNLHSSFTAIPDAALACQIHKRVFLSAHLGL